MNDPLAKAKEMQERYRKLPDSPRTWAEAILSGTRELSQVPEHMAGIVSDHIATHEMHVKASGDRILALPNGKQRLEAFNNLKEVLKEPVREYVHSQRSAKGTL